MNLGTKSQVEPSHYFNAKYECKEHFVAHWYQINEILRYHNKANILEIGVGNSFVSKYLKERKVNITTLDIDSNLKPDITASVTSLPFTNRSFDIIACYEVLEHIPYQNFKEALSELRRVSKNIVILSLPDSRPYIRICFSSAHFGLRDKVLSLPTILRKEFHFSGEHHWEIGFADYPLQRIEADIKAAGFITEKSYRVFEHPYHRFFLLRKL